MSLRDYTKAELTQFLLIEIAILTREELAETIEKIRHDKAIQLIENRSKKPPRRFQTPGECDLCGYFGELRVKGDWFVCTDETDCDKRDIARKKLARKEEPSGKSLFARFKV
jgi:hypothetical protein